MALHLEIVTPKGSVVDIDAAEVVLPGKLGEFAVLEGHIPLLSALRPGVVRYSGQNNGQLAVGAGFAEVGSADKVLVLVDGHALPDDIDLDEAKADLRDAEEDLKGWSEEIETLDRESDEWKETPEHAALLNRIAWIQAKINAVK